MAWNVLIATDFLLGNLVEYKLVENYYYLYQY